MLASRAIEPYPWGNLPAATRGALATERAVRAAARSVIPKLSTEAAKLLGRPCSISLTLVRAAEFAPRAQAQPVGSGAGPATRGAEAGTPAPDPLARGAAVWLSLDEPPARLALFTPPELALTAISSLLEVKAEVFRGGHLDDDLAGSWAALLLEVGRRAGTPFLALGSSSSGPTPMPIEVRASVDLGGQSYGLRAVVSVGSLGPSQPEPRRLADLGELPITLRLVAAVATVTGAELEGLEPGDALLPGSSWLCAPPGPGSAVLLPALSTRGFSVVVRENGSILLGGESVDVPLEVLVSAKTDPKTASAGAPRAVVESVLDAPLVVRAELGAVTLSAREWAALDVGDVIELKEPVGGPVVLRVAGRAVAEGELLSIEGELGVRILRLLGTGDA